MAHCIDISIKNCPGSWVEFIFNSDIFFCPWRFVLILANSADLDEMQRYAAFHLSLHCWQSIWLKFSSIQRAKGLKFKRLIILEPHNIMTSFS